MRTLSRGAREWERAQTVERDRNSEMEKSEIGGAEMHKGEKTETTSGVISAELRVEAQLALM